MAFEDLEARTAAAGIRHIGNCDVTLGAATGRGIFDAEANVLGDDLVGSLGPQVRVLSSLVPVPNEGDAIGITRAVNGVAATVAYTVTQHQPDGTGMTTLQLRLGS